MNKRRLERLARILDKADAEHKKRGEPTYLQRRFVHSCGTPACSIGHYVAATPKRWHPITSYLQSPMLINDSAYNTFDDIMREFDLTSDQADELFEADGCNNARTAKQAASYIRKFIKRNEAKS